MTDPKKRLIVDGVDFGGLFRFPRILRSVTSAMQPPRLVVALLMVVVLVGFGKIWDANTEARVSPTGLLAGPMSVEQVDEANSILWDAVGEFDVSERRLPPPGSRLEADEVLELLERTYTATRERYETGPTRDGEETGGIPMGAIRDKDERYAEVVKEIRRIAPKGAFEAAGSEVTGAFHETVRAVVYLRPQGVFDAWRNLFISLPVELWKQQRTFTVVYGILFIIVMSVGGGALCRMAACEFAGQERLRVRDAFDFALGMWLRLIITPVLPLCIAAVIALVMTLLGLFMAPYLDVVGGVLYGFAMLLGFLLVFMLVGYIVGLPMLLPAVACENCDPVDAQQRAYAYLLNRPLHLLGYAAVAFIGLAIGYLVVALVAALTLNFTAFLVGTFTGNSALSGAGGFGIFDLTPQVIGEIQEPWHNKWASWSVSFWQGAVIDLVAAYVVAYLFTSTTMIYLLMRRACDGQDIEEIWRPGLTPGTMVPLPRTRVEVSTEEPRKAAVAERIISGAMRTAAAATVGREDEDGEEDDARGEEEEGE